MGRTPLPVPVLVSPPQPINPIVIEQAKLDKATRPVTVTDPPVASEGPPPTSRVDPATLKQPLKINFIGAGAFAYLTKRHKLQVHAISIYDVNLAINSMRTKEE